MSAQAKKSRRRATKAQREYREKLRDPRWQKLRLEVLDAAGWRCSWCGSGERNIQIHHGYYTKGAEPWEYPPEALHVLCEHCHERAESLRAQVLEVLGLIHPRFHHQVFDGLEEFHGELTARGSQEA